ncbi:hypothetical protein jhhlp_006217 [Lomentospora prolificans]|uniref:Clock-controlled protein 6 n=1 Tax=Lomentospora prolificans TaxID=41688 RepID=A0A2N3N595_9PEZI|nr:hypothetical protein jhhlp_006217 [Lomentospora prolificans]
MKYAAVLALAGLAAAGAVPAQNGTVYTTEVVTAYTTYCPEATTITDGDNTITVTEPTTLTITHCPGGCTIKKPVYSTSEVQCYDCAKPTANATASYHPTGSVPTASPSQPVTAGAAKLAGAGLAAFIGAVAFL